MAVKELISFNMSSLSHNRVATESRELSSSDMRLKGVLFMVLASLFFTVMHLFAKKLALAIPVSEIAFFRSLVTLLVILPWMAVKNVSLFGDNKRLLFVRGTFGFISLLLGFFAISKIKLGDVTVLWKTSVVFTAAFAAIFLKERVSLSLIALIGVAMVGAALIVKPGFDVINLGGLAALAAGVCVGIVTVSVRRLHQTESSLTIIFSFSFWSVVLALLFFGHDFVVPSFDQLIELVSMGMVGTLGQIFFTRAFIHAPASLLQPYAFSEVIFSMLAGYCLWGELPGSLSLIGTILIIVSGVGILKYSTPRVESVTEES